MRTTSVAASRLATTAFLFFAFDHAEGRILNVPEDYQTIQAGIDASRNWDTVLVSAGRYFERIDFQGKIITLLGDPIHPENVIIDPDGEGRAFHFHSRETAAAKLIGFTLQNGDARNENYHNGGAIFCESASPTLSHLIIRHNRASFGGGISLHESSPSLDYVLFYGNVTDNGGGGGIDIALRSNPQINHATFVGNASGAGGGIWVYDNSHPEIMNSILWDNSPQEIAFPDDRDQQITIFYADIRGGRDSILFQGRGEIFWGGGNIDADPLFLDPDNGDYSLTADSPCIDAGDPDSPRDPDGTRADMGAFYFRQKDIEVYPQALWFGALPFGEIDSQLVIVANTGGTPLTIRVTETEERSSITIAVADGREIVVQPNQGRALWAFYRPAEGAVGNQVFLISSDDPDEPEITIEATEVLAANDPQLSTFRFQLSPAYPNPFNSSTTIRFSQSAESAQSAVRLATYGVDGRLVKDLLTGKMPVPREGEHSIIWNAEGLQGGIYLVRLESGSEVRTMKTILLK